MGKSIKDEINKSKKETEMKKSIFKSTAAIVTYSVAATLLVVCGAYKVYQWGHTDGIQHEVNRSAEVDTRVSEKVSALEQLKPQQ